MNRYSDDSNIGASLWLMSFGSKQGQDPFENYSEQTCLLSALKSLFALTVFLCLLEKLYCVCWDGVKTFHCVYVCYRNIT